LEHEEGRVEHMQSGRRVLRLLADDKIHSVGRVHDRHERQLSERAVRGAVVVSPLKRGNATAERCGILAWVLVLALTVPVAATAQPSGWAATFTP